jgi:23S rRNA (cytosine1962-C5)-methyltransferase
VNAVVESLPVLVLNPNAERRLRAGHVWIYSNEIDTKKSPLKNFENGQQVLVHAANGKPLGIAYINPHACSAAIICSINRCSCIA